MRRALVIALALAAVGYGFFEARQLIAGPTITLVAPLAGTATSSPAVYIAGVARNISFLTINDAPAYTDEAGNFADVLTPPPGYTTVTVAATDRFGRSVKQTVAITVLNYCIDETQG